MNWISLHIFHNHSFEEILVHHIHPLTAYLKKEGYITAMFFIRYAENGEHIRYRILPSENCDQELLKELILEKSKLYFDSLQNTEISFRFELSDYIQETQRYGGEESIHIAEKHFQDSSKIALELIKDDITNWDYSKAISAALQMHIIFAKQTTNDLQMAFQLFELVYKNWLYYSVKLDSEEKATQHEIQKVTTFFENSYTQQKDTLQYLVKTLWQENQESNWVQDWSSSCNELNTLLINSTETNEFNGSNVQHLTANPDLNSMDKKKFVLFDSFIHMTNNRLGINLRDEAFIAYLIARSLKEMV